MNACALALTAVAASVLAGTAPAASPSDGAAWLHVRVEEPRQGSKGSRVNVNLPMTAVEAALEAVPETIASDGRFHLGRHGNGMKVEEFRRLWTELKGTGDAELVSVDDDDEHVSVSRKGDLLQIRVQEHGERETVYVDVPTAVVDALFSGPGQELNLRAALAELRTRRGDVVRVNDRSSTVRIWIDDSAGAQGDK
jgi:hypothetical protein